MGFKVCVLINKRRPRRAVHISPRPARRGSASHAHGHPDLRVGVRELLRPNPWRWRLSNPPWEIGSAIPGAQVHTSLCDVKPTSPTVFIFSDDSNFRAPTDRRITFRCLPLPCLPWGDVTRASLTVRPAGPPRFSHLGTDLRAQEQSSDDHHLQKAAR